MGDTCYEACPEGFYGDTSSYTCEPCNSECLQCLGPMKTDCLSCKDKKLLVGQECIVIVCIDGMFWDWINLVCTPCHESCAKCEPSPDPD
jgi:proprotein convertase subtilisin/kexin type 5